MYVCTKRIKIVKQKTDLSQQPNKQHVSVSVLHPSISDTSQVTIAQFDKVTKLNFDVGIQSS